MSTLINDLQDLVGQLELQKVTEAEVYDCLHNMVKYYDEYEAEKLPIKSKLDLLSVIALLSSGVIIIAFGIAFILALFLNVL